MYLEKLLFYCMLSTSLFALGVSNPVDTQKAELIPVEVLSSSRGRPYYSNVSLSPDGMTIAYITNSKKVSALCIKGLGGSEKILISTQLGGIVSYHWTPDSTSILYVKEVGSGRQKLYGLNVINGKITCYTPNFTLCFSAFDSRRDIHDHVLVAFSKSKRSAPDLYTLTLSTGVLKLLLKNNGKIARFICDAGLEPRIAVSEDFSNLRSQTISISRFFNNEWVPIIKRTLNAADAAFNFEVYSLAEDNVSLYIIDGYGANTDRLVKLDILTGKIEVIAQDTCYNASDIFINDKGKLQAIAFERARKEWMPVDERFDKMYKAFDLFESACLDIVSHDAAQQRYIVRSVSDIHEGKFFMYDADMQKITHLFDQHPLLNGYAFAHVKPISFKSRDGLLIHGYLTLPARAERTMLPLVLYVHGGPYIRDIWGFDFISQLLANRGYAVLQINYRGSRGYGKDFERAAFKEWGRKMQDDLIDGVQWAINQKIADPAKIAIMGGSYGGYAALMGATETPDLFCCALAAGSPSNLHSYTTWALSELLRPGLLCKEEMVAKICDPCDVDFLKKYSPFFKVDAIKIPLFIAHGAQDPIVKVSQSDELVKMLRRRGKDYTYLRFKEEKHGIVYRENLVSYLSAIEQFLAKHLGGKCDYSSLYKQRKLQGRIPCRS